MKIFDNDDRLWEYGMKYSSVFVLCAMILIIIVAINCGCDKMIHVYKNYSAETISKLDAEGGTAL